MAVQASITEANMKPLTRWNDIEDKCGNIGRSAVRRSPLSFYRIAILLAAIGLLPTGGYAATTALVSIAELQTRREISSHAVSVRGSVTLLGEQVTIQDRTGALQLRLPKGESPFALGDEVEASGTLVHLSPAVFEASSVRRLWGDSMPLPMALDPDHAASGDLNGTLVQIDGRLLSATPSADHGLHLTMQGANQTFDAVFLSGRVPELSVTRRWERDSELRLIGVLAVQQGKQEMLTGAPFQLILRSDEDVEVLRPAPWWTGEHIAWLALALLGCVFLLYLRTQRDRAARLRAVLDERSRIARDIHDTLAQGFAGITLQLESALVLLPKKPDAATCALQLGLQMVRHSRAESHSAIRVLRSMSRNESLDHLFSKAVEEFGSNLPTVVQQKTTGAPFSLSYQLTSHLYHIGVEAMANSLQHAAAKSVCLSVEYCEEHLRLCVLDDGHGFNPAAVRGMGQGHFGLTGMRERAAAISAELKIESDANCGTTVLVIVPRRP